MQPAGTFRLGNKVRRGKIAKAPLNLLPERTRINATVDAADTRIQDAVFIQDAVLWVFGTGGSAMLSRTAIRQRIPFVLAFAVFWLGVASDHFLTKLSPSRIFVAADDLIISVVLGCVVLFYERRRRRYLEARLKVISEMNHHVRNALQVLSYTTIRQEDEKVRNMMRDSVTRIDWALREVLPADDLVA